MGLLAWLQRKCGGPTTKTIAWPGYTDSVGGLLLKRSDGLVTEVVLWAYC